MPVAILAACGFAVASALTPTPWKGLSSAIIEEATLRFANLAPLELPPGLADLTADTAKGQVRANSVVLGDGEAVARLRVTNIDAGPGGQVLNSVLVPNPALGGCPLLGIDCTFLGGKRIFWGADYFPLSQDDAYAERWLGALSHHKERASAMLSPPGPSPYPIDEATGRGEFFSAQQLFCRPPAADDAERDAAFAAASEVLVPLVADYMAMLQRELAASARPKSSRGAGELGREAAARRSREYIAWNRAHDPAAGLLKAWFSAEKSEEFADTVLFAMPF